MFYSSNDSSTLKAGAHLIYDGIANFTNDKADRFVTILELGNAYEFSTLCETLETRGVDMLELVILVLLN